MSSTPSETLRSRWLAALLPNVPFDGWTQVAAEAAAEEAGLSAGEQALAAPGGVTDLIDAFFTGAERDAAAALEKVDMSDMRVPEKVAAGVEAWLAALAPNREAVRRAAARGMLPWGAGAAIQRAWSVADMVWTAAGDTSEDYNRYSKRGILAAVLPPIVLKWLDQPDDEEMRTFIDSRLRQASGVGQFAGRFAKPVLDRFSKARERS